MEKIPERFYVNMSIKSVFSLNKRKNFCLYFEIISADFNLEENVWIVKYQIYGPIEKLMKKRIWYSQIKLLFRKIDTITLPIINKRLIWENWMMFVIFMLRRFWGNQQYFLIMHISSYEIRKIYP